MLLVVAAVATLGFAGKLWASALRPRSIVLLPRTPPLPAPPPTHLTAPRIVVPVSPSVAAHLGLNGSSGRGARSYETAGGYSRNSSSTGPNALAAGTGSPADASGGTAPGAAGQRDSGKSHASHSQKPPTHGPKRPPHHGPPPRPPHHPPPPHHRRRRLLLPAAQAAAAASSPAAKPPPPPPPPPHKPPPPPPPPAAAPPPPPPPPPPHQPPPPPPPPHRLQPRHRTIRRPVSHLRLGSPRSTRGLATAMATRTTTTRVLPGKRGGANRGEGCGPSAAASQRIQGSGRRW